MSTEPTVYEVAGGQPFFEELVDRFYDRVERDPELLTVYPQPQDLGPARRHLSLFLAEYWGGPSLYSAERGHPRLRMRHASFAIGAAEVERWFAHMRASVEEMEPPERALRSLLEYFERAAPMLKNRA